MNSDFSNDPQMWTNVGVVSRKQGKHCKPKKPQGNLRAKTAIALVLLSGLSCVAATLPHEAQDSRQASQQLSLPTPAITPSNEPTPAPTALPTLVQEKPSVTTSKVEEPPVAGKPAYSALMGTLTVPKFRNGVKEIYQGGSINAFPYGTQLARGEVCAVVEEKRKCLMPPVLDKLASTGGTAVAHYPSSAMPGGVGNLNLAGHRGGGNNGPFTYIDALELGDDLFITNELGTYRYTFLWRDANVDPGNKSILKEQVFRTKDKVPGQEVTKALLLTACGLTNADHLQKGNDAVREVAYFEYVSFEAVK